MKIFFAQCSMEGRVFEMFLKNQKFSKFQKCPKSFPNCPKVFWTCFEVIFSKIFFCRVFHGRSSLRNVFVKKLKTFQIPKMPKIVPKLSKRVLNKFWGNFSEKNFCPVFHGWSSLRNVFKKSKIFQNFIIAQNRSQKCPNVFWTCFEVIFPKSFFAQCSMEGRVFEMFLKNEKFFKLP